MNLVNDWKEAHTWLSMRIMGLAAALPPAWLAIPDDWKAVVPRWAILTFTFICLSAMVGRVVDQKPKVP